MDLNSRSYFKAVSTLAKQQPTIGLVISNPTAPLVAATPTSDPTAKQKLPINSSDQNLLIMIFLFIDPASKVSFTKPIIKFDRGSSFF